MYLFGTGLLVFQVPLILLWHFVLSLVNEKRLWRYKLLLWYIVCLMQRSSDMFWQICACRLHACILYICSSIMIILCSPKNEGSSFCSSILVCLSSFSFCSWFWAVLFYIGIVLRLTIFQA